MDIISISHKSEEDGGGIDYEKSLMLLFKAENETRNWINMTEEREQKQDNSEKFFEAIEVFARTLSKD